MEDWLGGVSCLSKSRREGRSMETLIVGVDVSKESFSVTGLTAAEQAVSLKRFPWMLTGFQSFLRP